MPYHIVHETGGKYEVMNKDSGKKHGKTSKKNAESQMKLLRAIEHGYKPTGTKSGMKLLEYAHLKK
jgi:hypothetical protein